MPAWRPRRCCPYRRGGARKPNISSGPITLIVPFPPGGGTDASSRTIAQAITQLKGWNIVAENRPGAGGNIGLGLLSHANRTA